MLYISFIYILIYVHFMCIIYYTHTYIYIYIYIYMRINLFIKDIHYFIAEYLVVVHKNNVLYTDRDNLLCPPKTSSYSDRKSLYPAAPPHATPRKSQVSRACPPPGLSRWLKTFQVCISI